MNSNATTGLILTGGGARAAYQVGVFGSAKAIGVHTVQIGIG